MKYFWLEGKDLPEAGAPGYIGFGHFTPQHFAALACCAVGIVLLCVWFLHCTAKGQDKFLRWTAIAMLLGNIARDIFLSVIGRMSVAYLPFHLCSFAIFVYLLHAFLPERFHRFREYLGEVGFTLLMPGTICALLFPDWTKYPLWNFMSLHSFIWHAVLVAYPMMLFLSGRIHPSIRHYWYPLVYLAVITPPTALFNHLTGCNYLFIMWPLPDTPQEWLYNRMGAYWRVGYALVVAAVVLCVYLVIELIRIILKATGHNFPGETNLNRS